MYGNTTAYAYGQVAGTVVGIGVQIGIGNVIASGALCNISNLGLRVGGKLATGLYLGASAANDIASGVDQISTGLENGSLFQMGMGALSLAGGLGDIANLNKAMRIQCFVGETLVIVPAPPRLRSNVIDEPEEEVEPIDATTLIFISSVLPLAFLYGTRAKRDRREERSSRNNRALVVLPEH